MKISYKIIFLTLVFIFTAHTIHAETHIYGNDLLHGGSWNKEGSPYILDESVYIPRGFSLRIGEGVTVMTASSTVDYPDPNSLTFDGDISIEGTADNPVKFYDMNSLYFSHSNVTIDHALFSKTGMDFWQSTSTISDIIVQYSDTAISARGSNLSIDHSRIINNRIGIGSSQYFKVFQALRYFFPDIISTAFAFAGSADTTLDPEQNIISIHNSIITGNSEYGISQGSTNLIDATNNWWGSKSGPRTDFQYDGGDKIYGPVDTNPWLSSDPDISKYCCSNVLFIPGIEASRLYKDSFSSLVGTSTNQLWEPNRNDDVKKLYLDTKGKSLDPSVYTSDVIDSALGLIFIYKSFIAMMNGVVADGYIHSWLPFPYDWRMNAEEVVRERTILATTSISLIEEVENLTKNSKTGKVIVISHSNGGLVAKELLKALEEKSESSLIEKVINVAVPELGTPQAILSMLHGNGQSIAGNLILSEDNARLFSQNMPSAYGLLPSRKFLENNPITIISNLFSSSSNPIVSTYENMKNFLVSNSFSLASSSDINIPILLNKNLLEISDKLHDSIDSWKPSSSTKVLSIFGWGVPTSESIIYDKDPHCNESFREKCDVTFLPTLTREGDGTVSTKSNSGNADQTIFFDLKKLNNNLLQKEITHANILESTDLLAMVKDTIIVASTSKPSYEKYFSKIPPIDTDKYLVIKIHSPVDIHIYDKFGNHTGIIEDPVIGRDLNSFENNIPLSFYHEYGKTKFIEVPYNQDYQIILKGNGTGVFSVDTEVIQSDKVIATSTFSDMPVTPLLNIDFVISTSTVSFASSTFMNMDVDGDGTADFVNRPNEYTNATNTDIQIYLESIRKVIITLQLPTKKEAELLNRIDKILKIISKNHPKKLEKIVKKLSTKRFKNKVLTDVQKATLLSIFDKLLSYIESTNK